MKKVTAFAAMALTALMMTGCASIKESWAKATEPPPPDTRDPMTKWVEDRSFAKEIAEKQAAGATITAEDVFIKPELEYRPLYQYAASVADLYAPVVNGVHHLTIQSDGRQIYVGVQNDIKNGAKAEEILASMPAEDKAAYTAYAKLVAETDIDAAEKYAGEISEKRLVMSAALVNLVKQAKGDLKGLKKMEKITAIGALMAANSDLSAELSSINDGLTLWQELLAKDKEAKAFMAEYPVE